MSESRLPTMKIFQYHRCRDGIMLENKKRRPSFARRDLITGLDTLTVLPPLPANYVHFRLDLVVGQFRPRVAPPVRIRQHRIEPFCKKAIEECSSLLGRKLPSQFPELINRDGNRQTGHDITSLA